MKMTPFLLFSRWLAAISCCVLAAMLVFSVALAQGTGSITGRVVDAKTGEGLPGISVAVKGTRLGAATGRDGNYTIRNVPSGTYTLVFSGVGFSTVEVSNVVVKEGEAYTANAELSAVAIPVSEMTVYGASLRPERITEAPAAVSVLGPEEIKDHGSHGQLPRLLEAVPGVDIVQNGVYDFNINTRGFNSSLNRRLLVLMDGRDLSVVLLGAQEWNGLPVPLEDIGRIELVRGPGSALYGANAFNGVLNITTAAPRDIVGTKIAVTGGQLSTFRGDIRHAGVSGPWGYRINIGGIRSDTWTVSRDSARAKPGSIYTDRATGFKKGTFEYPDLLVEAKKYDPDKLSSLYGSLRVDRDFEGGAFLTAETGISQTENEVVLTGIGRVHVARARRPYGRVAYTSANFYAQFWAAGRKAMGPHYSLQSGGPLITTSENAHLEFQHNFDVADNRLRVVWGASHRYQHENTENTLMPAPRFDNSSGIFAQAEYKFTDRLKGLVAGRFDRSTLHDDQVSPKAAIVFSPVSDHSLRLTFNRAFQVPNYSELFLEANVGAPSPSPRQLELGLEQYFAAVKASLPAALVSPLNLPSNLPWEFRTLTRVLALGNKSLKVEKITGWEVGYKGLIENRVYVTVDAYVNRLTDFVTDLLPAVNQSYPTYSLSDGGTNIPKNLSDLNTLYNQLNLPATHPLRQNLAVLQAGYLSLASQLGPLLATLPGGERAGVISYTNAGKVDERGFEVAARISLTDEISVDANWAYFDFKVKERKEVDVGGGVKLTDILLPNAPKHKVNLTLSYASRAGYNAGVTMKWVTGYPWAAGIFSGNVPEYTIVNLVAGYQITKNVHLGVNVYNLFDRKHYELFGGSMLERRALGTITTTF